MKKNLIFSLDTKNRKTVLRYARKIAEMRRIPGGLQTSELERLSKSMFAIKIGILNIVDHGLSIIKDIKQITKTEVICDLKLADIPYIAGEVARKVADAGADYLVVQAFVGEKTVSQVVEAAPHLKIILVSEMTHNDGGFTQKNLDDFAMMAKKVKVFGIIGPGNRPQRIRRIKEIVGNQVKIIAAGVSEQQGGEEKAAIDAGADLLIKGRSIMDKLDRQIEARIFDLDLRTIKVNVLLPAGIYALAAIILNIILSRLSLGDTSVNISITAAFAIVGVILHNTIRRR